MGNLIFNGVSTEDLGVVIQTPPTYEFASRDYEVIHIQGKSGDIVIDNKSYQNTKRTYYLAKAFRDKTKFVENVNALVTWLTSASGYARLEDSYEPDYFRMALFRDEGSLTNLYDKATAITITFECKPQRYLKKGEIPINISKIDTYVRIINTTAYTALPEISMDGDNLTIEFISGKDKTQPNNTSILSSTYNQMCIIDSELEDCYTETNYINDKITLTNGFPKLYPGVNWIKISGTALRSFAIKPRWWQL